MAVTRIAEFDLWRNGYGGSLVNVYLSGTTTLASIYTDEALSIAAPNPQTLDSLVIDNEIYGKFTVPLYIGAAYYLDVVTKNQTGIIRPPLTTLTGQVADEATVIPTGGAVANPLDDLLGREFYATDTAAFTTSASTNNATLTTALGRAASAGGGKILLPDNTALVFTQLTLANGVQLEGRGRSGTPTILQSQVADKIVTLNTGSGLQNLALDGINNVASGIALYAKATNETNLRNVLIKRFDTGIKLVGGRYANWHEVYVDSCAIGATLQGNLDTAGGDQYSDNSWYGGKISNCTTVGIRLTYEDRIVSNVKLANLIFDGNTGTALDVNGARFVTLENVKFLNNTINIAIADDTLNTVSDNTIKSFSMVGGSIAGGVVNIDGSCQNVVFKRVDFSNVQFNFTNIGNNITFVDCVENSGVVFTGQGTRVTRVHETFGDFPASAVTTTDATVTKIWEISLEPGQKAFLEAKVIGVMRNGVDYGMYHYGRAVHRPGATLAYDGQTGNFTKGLIVVGHTSGATARIIADADAGVTGTLTLKSILGTFVDNELLTDTSTGSATANGTLTLVDCALLGSLAAIEADVETVGAWGAAYAVAAGNIELQVTGAAVTVIDWVANVSSSVN
jgi:hypothetical protein